MMETERMGSGDPLEMRSSGYAGGFIAGKSEEGGGSGCR